MKIHRVLLLCFSALCGSTANPYIYTGPEGGTGTINCHLARSGSRKFFCKDQCGPGDVLVQTDGDSAQRGRFSITYKDESSARGIVSVTITNMTRSDSGRYRCGLGGTSLPESHSDFDIQVWDDPVLSGVSGLARAVPEGGNVTYGCSYTVYGNQKFLCRGECKTIEDVIIQSDGNRSQSGRFSLEYKPTSVFGLYVTITHSRSSDTQRYKCGYGNALAPDSSTTLPIIIIQEPRTSGPSWTSVPAPLSSSVPSAPTTAPSAGFNESIQSRGAGCSTRPASDHVLPLVVCGALVGVLLLVVVLLLLYIRKMKSSFRGSGSSSAELSAGWCGTSDTFRRRSSRKKKQRRSCRKKKQRRSCREEATEKKQRRSCRKKKQRRSCREEAEKKQRRSSRKKQQEEAAGRSREEEAAEKKKLQRRRSCREEATEKKQRRSSREEAAGRSSRKKQQEEAEKKKLQRRSCRKKLQRRSSREEAAEKKQQRRSSREEEAEKKKQQRRRSSREEAAEKKKQQRRSSREEEAAEKKQRRSSSRHSVRMRGAHTLSCRFFLSLQVLAVVLTVVLTIQSMVLTNSVISVYSVTEGEDFSARCLSSSKGRTRLKFFCRGRCDGGRSLITTSGAAAVDGRYGLQYRGKELTVNVSRLRKSDSDLYTCGVGRRTSFIRIIVVDAADPPGFRSTTARIPSDESDRPTTEEAPTTGGDTEPSPRAAWSVWVYVGLSLALVVLLLSLALVFFCRKRSSSAKAVAVETDDAQTSPVYEDLREDRSTAPPAGPSPLYSSVHYVKQSRAGSGADASPSTVEDKDITYSELNFSSGSSSGAVRGQSEDVVYSEPRRQ
ncbi:uncharacterized protein V6R79_003739 [Siganus canaliculatus]